MKLTNDQIKGILFGAVEIPETPEGITGRRYSAPILEQWGNLSKELHKNAGTTTGLRLDFETNATDLVFTVSGNPFEFLVDGLLTGRSEQSETPVALSVSLDGKGHRVTLVFPSHAPAGVLYGVEVNDGATVTPHKYGEKFLFLGDSITQGWDSGIDSLSYAWRTSLFFNADCVIQGVGGAYFHPSVFEAPEDFDPDRVFVAFGTNDFGHFKTLGDLQSHASAYLDKVMESYSRKKIYGITPIWRYDTWEKSMGTFDECISVIRGEYEKRGITVFDGLTFVPHDKTFFADTLHPNALGFSLYAENLIRAIENSAG